MRLIRFIVLRLFLCVGVASVTAQESALVRTDHLRSQLLSSQSSVVPGHPFWVALRLQHDAPWHSYWKVSGDSGLPTEITWQLPPGWQASEIHWPLPRRVAYGDLTSFIVPEDALLLVQLTPPATPPSHATFAPVTLRAQAHWLVCHEVCIPGQGDYALTLDVAPQATPSIWQPRLQAAVTALPKTLSHKNVRAHWGTTGVMIDVTFNAGQKLPTTLSYFPYQANVIDHAATQPLSLSHPRSARTLTVTVAPNQHLRTPWHQAEGLLVADEGADANPWVAHINVPIVGTPPTPTSLPPLTPAPQVAPLINPVDPPPRHHLGWTWLAAFFGGMILNLMPCVFPVLSIKVLTVVQHEAHHPGTLHRHGLWYGVGVIVGCLMLGALLLVLRAAGMAVGWGFQLQSPLFVFALAALFTLIALNLFGAFDIRWGQTQAARADQVVQQSRLHPYLSALLTGLLAVIIATPCSAPFMGAALGVALTQPALWALSIFAALGAGLALPYVVLCYVPGWLNSLPAPGAWMERCKHLLAFPMLATVVWLLSVYGLQTSAQQQFEASLVLCLLALALWAWGQHQHAHSRDARHSRWAWLSIASLLLVMASAYTLHRDANPAQSASLEKPSMWQPYSDAAMQAALAEQKTVFVDFTAAWCVSCQLNKKLVLDTPRVQQALARSGMVLMRADWTRHDEAIRQTLQKLGRNSVPVYWIQRPHQAPLLLPEVLTTEVVLAAIR